jgi:DNA polymerase elongation subunit (family B)
MDKHKVLGEIKAFLEGYNQEIKYLVNVETSYSSDIAECVIHEPNQPPRIENIRYVPFMYMKDLKRFGRELYVGQSEEYIKSKQIKYGITITKLKTGNQKRLLDGYCYKLESHRSANDITQYLKDGGLDPLEKLVDEHGHIVRDHNNKIVYKNREFFYSPSTTEQFFISTQSRLYKGFEQYKEVHRLTLDIETTALRYQIGRILNIGIRDNRGFETILHVEKRDDDEAEMKLIQDMFNTIDMIKPAVILGHNVEEFDFEFVLGRVKMLKMVLKDVPQGLKAGVMLKRKGGTSVKYGNTSDKYTATKMWGYSVIDTLHAAKRTAAVNSDLKLTNLKYVAKFEKFAKPDRTYIKGEDNGIGKMYTENKVFVINEMNQYIQIPDEFQAVSTNLYKLQENKNKIDPEKYKVLRKRFLDENTGFVTWFRENAVEKKMNSFINGRKIVDKYLLDDIWETEQVDELYNQSSFMLAKIVPTTYTRICTMGTASIWNLLLTTWSYENDLAIPIPDKKENFGGGLARTFKKGYTERLIKIDYASLYPMIQLTDDVFPMFDITGVMKKMLLYMTTTRNIYKKMGGGTELDTEETDLLRQLDHEAHVKYTSNTLMKEDVSMFKVKQLPIKILNNSLYGALGSDISFNWSDNICAARITSVGRIQLRHAVHWFAQFGCTPLLCVTDGVNFKIPDKTSIRVTDEGITEGVNEGLNEEMWHYRGKTGIQALIEKFNEEEMPKPYMSVDDDGESVSCLNLARINYATLSEIKDKKTGEVKKKIKLTGNTIKSKIMSEYIEEFMDKGFDLILHGKGKEFVDYYYSYAEDIRYMQIPLKKIASKSKVKQTIKSYQNRGKDKNGREKGKQAHMELLIEQRRKQAVELFEKHKLDVGFEGDESKLTPDDKMKLIINYMPPEPELDSTVYYINTGYVKSHGDSKEIKDRETGEMRMACSLISNEDLQNNPDMTGTYNYEKYLDAFNKRVCYTQKKIGSLLSAFEPEVAEKIPVKVIKKGEKKGELQKEMFTRDQLELKNFDLDFVDEAMYLEKKEVDFWNKTGYDPRKVWDGFKMHDDYKVYYEIYENALAFLNEKMKESGKPAIKSINDNYQDGDLVLIKDGSEYHVGAFNGVFLQIVRDNVRIPKSDIELELDRQREEKQKNIDNLEGSELGKKTDREVYLEGQQKKREAYFKDFIVAFRLPEGTTMEKLFEDVPEAKDAFETFIVTNDNAAEATASEYLDISDGGDGAY